MDTEKKDIYIAAAVGGVALVLIYLYVHSSNPVAVNADGSALPSVTSTPPPLPTPYTYNVEPYQARPGIENGAVPQSKTGCCDTCGPSTGANYFNTNVAQFQTLMGYGSDAGAA